MTLRRRLAIAFCVIALLLVGVFGYVIHRQSAALTRSLDSQLEDMAGKAGRLASKPRSKRKGKPRGRGKHRPPAAVERGVFVGLIDAGGELQPLAGVGGSAPQLTGAELDSRSQGSRTPPFTVSSGNGTSMRVMGVRAGGRWVVIGLPADEVEAARGELMAVGAVALVAVLAILALLLWWVDRLGLRPIEQVAAAAERIGAGDLSQRVARSKPGTEVDRLAAAFNTMADARQNADERLRRFVADASHELRTPLTTLRGYTALFAAGGMDDRSAVADAMRRISGEAERMGGLVDDLLLLAALDEGRPLDLAAVDVGRVVADAASDAQAVQPRRPIAVEVDGPVVACADEQRLVQLVTALLANALKHTPEDVAVRVGAATAADGVAITVHDAGPGIPEEQVAHLFERFYRGDPARGRGRKGGSGLGLSIVEAIVEAHGGTVGVVSAPGAGTTFTVTLPARAGEADPVAPTAATPPGGRDGSVR